MGEPRPDPARRRSPAERREVALGRRARRAEVTDPDVVMDAAAAFLGVRPRSVAETRSRLRHLGYPPPLCDTVVERLLELGYLDDRAFAQAWLQSRDRAHPRGRLALAQELARKGVPREVVEEALRERDEAAPRDHPGAPRSGDGDPEAVAVEEAAAARLLQRRAGALAREPDPRRRRQKGYALLARHGFAPDVCRRVAATLGEASEDAGDDA